MPPAFIGVVVGLGVLLLIWVLVSQGDENAEIDAITELQWLDRGHTIRLAAPTRTATYFLGRKKRELPHVEIALDLSHGLAEPIAVDRVREWSKPTTPEPSVVVNELVPLTFKGSPEHRERLSASSAFLQHLDRLEALQPRTFYRWPPFVGPSTDTASIVSLSVEGKTLKVMGQCETKDLVAWLRECEDLGETVSELLSGASSTTNSLQGQPTFAPPSQSP